ncbi:CPBP family intramembrane metalloprotease [Corynebacterium canis]|uniref:CPBP family intramembrane metalloprotease n=1 Tax=Corynebacterium canis TaxID=679663 RepID=A0A5C5UE73_9CORY|nr:type II CAAX endopeptidase family protein [Corynebacterium canis]TWT24464.1 CPBP family intramembrane metalloprotease [Corynebacterium canis]
MEKLMEAGRRHPFAAFVVLAYAGSWLGWAPMWASRNGLGILPIELPFAAIAGFNQLGLFLGPFAAAFLVTRLLHGREGVRKLWRKMFQWRVHPCWYFAAVVAIPVSIVGSYLLSGSHPAGATSIGALAVSFVVFLLGGPVQEEPGWRGVALPLLQERFSTFNAALILGFVHTFWHLPMFTVREWDTAGGNPSQLVAYLVLVLSLSVILAWLFDAAPGSLLPVILAHNAVNWALVAFMGEAADNSWPAALGLLVFALLVVLTGRLRASRAHRTPRSSMA